MVDSLVVSEILESIYVFELVGFRGVFWDWV